MAAPWDSQGAERHQAWWVKRAFVDVIEVRAERGRSNLCRSSSLPPSICGRSRIALRAQPSETKVTECTSSQQRQKGDAPRTASAPPVAWVSIGPLVCALVVDRRSFVLRQTRAPVWVGAPSGMRSRIARRHPRLGGSLYRGCERDRADRHRRLAGYGWTSGETVARFGIVVVGVMILAVRLLIWLSDT